IDNDGWPDLYVSLLGQSNHLFRNLEGKGFTDVSQSAKVAMPRFSFPTWSWDVDQDGWEDLFVMGYNTQRYFQVGYDVAAEYLGQTHRAALPRLYRNLGNGQYAEESEAWGLNKVLYAMGCNFGDFDNDGWLDAYVGTGAPDMYSAVPNRAFQNVGGTHFIEVTAPGGFGQIQKGHAVAFGDLDRDGDQDIYTVIGGSVGGDVFPNMLLENPGWPDHHWVVLQLEGRKANRSALGARVELVLRTSEGGQRHLYRRIGTGGSFGASSLQLEVGLGRAEALDRVIVSWPIRGLPKQVYSGLEMNRAYRLIEGVAEPRSIAYTPVKLHGTHGHQH
ncbi:MAG: CRTAC1 family protein, partial [Bacteroidota bacterium]